MHACLPTHMCTQLTAACVSRACAGQRWLRLPQVRQPRCCCCRRCHSRRFRRRCRCRWSRHRSSDSLPPCGCHCRCSRRRSSRCHGHRCRRRRARRRCSRRHRRRRRCAAVAAAITAAAVRCRCGHCAATALQFSPPLSQPLPLTGAAATVPAPPPFPLLPPPPLCGSCLACIPPFSSSPCHFRMRSLLVALAPRPCLPVAVRSFREQIARHERKKHEKKHTHLR